MPQSHPSAALTAAATALSSARQHMRATQLTPAMTGSFLNKAQLSKETTALRIRGNLPAVIPLGSRKDAEPDQKLPVFTCFK